MKASGNTSTSKGLGLAVLLTEVHESGHLALSELDLLAADRSVGVFSVASNIPEGGKGDVGNLVRGLGCQNLYAW